jgi:hypothetical protein
MDSNIPTTVCLFHDTPTRPLREPGFLARLISGDNPDALQPIRHGWHAKLYTPGAQCEEYLGADLDARQLYLAFNRTLTSLSNYFGVYGANCDDPLDAEPCHSAFMAYAPLYCQSANDPHCLQQVKSPSPPTVLAIAREAGVFPLLELARKEAAEKKYYDDYANALTIEGIERFKQTYSSADTALLIPKLEIRIAEIQLAKYRADFQQADTIEKLATFCQTYRISDPDHLVPNAQKKVDENARREQERIRQAQIQLNEDKRRSQLAELESVIRTCKGVMSDAYSQIDRENQAGAISGYVNKLVLMRAGENIVGCKREIENDYSQYRQAGGTKILAAIK